MRVAHLDTGRTWRGGQAQVLLLMRELRARGVVQRLWAPAGPLFERAHAEAFDVVPWDAAGELDLPAILKARRTLAAFAPDIAHLHSAHAHALGVPAARLARVAGVVVSRRVDFSVRGNLFSQIKYAMPVDRYFCISRGVMEVMRTSGIPDKLLALVPSGIDLAAVRAESSHSAFDLRARLDLPGGAEIVGTVASLAPHKNHALLLEAAPALFAARPMAHMVWLGEGECRPELERRRAELGLEGRVHLLGFHPDAKALMTQFTVFCLSSHLEGLCTSLLDAQALGVPIVATAVGGIPEVIDDGVTGRLVRSLQPGLLATALIEALAQPSLRDRWAVAGRTAVEAFSISVTAERSRSEYQRILTERTMGPRLRSGHASMQ
ncbi:MAG: glycosyltransferase [Candidatus Eisenbacteria bacterium]